MLKLHVQSRINNKDLNRAQLRNVQLSGNTNKNARMLFFIKHTVIMILKRHSTGFKGMKLLQEIIISAHRIKTTNLWDYESFKASTIFSYLKR